MNLLGATLVLLNSLYYGAYPSVGVNAAWIAIGAFTLAKHLSHAMIPGRSSEAQPDITRVDLRVEREHVKQARQFVGEVRGDTTGAADLESLTCRCVY